MLSRLKRKIRALRSIAYKLGLELHDECTFSVIARRVQENISTPKLQLLVLCKNLNCLVSNSEFKIQELKRKRPQKNNHYKERKDKEFTRLKKQFTETLVGRAAYGLGRHICQHNRRVVSCF